MIAGHFFLAFTLAVLSAHCLGFEKEKALRAGFLCGAFALLPDIDILYAFKEVVQVTSGFWAFSESFWSSSAEIHRGITHSLLTLSFASLGFIVYRKTDSRIFGTLFLISMMIYGYAVSGLLSSLILGLFTLAGIGIVEFSRRKVGFKEFLGASLTGLLLHPFGDVFTGVPPKFFYPAEFNLVSSKIVLFPDPSVNFLSVFGLELFLIWAGVISYLWIGERGLLDDFGYSSGLGIFFGAAIFLISSPSLSRPYGFVFSIIGFSLGLTALIWFLNPYRERKKRHAVLDFVGSMTAAYLSFLLMLILV